MNIENRMNDVVKLRANACQDLATLILPSDWRDKLYKVMVDAINTGINKDKYIEPYKKIKSIGIENFNISDMDVTLINNIFHEKNICYTTSKIRNLMEDVAKDRNLTDHSSLNEEANELYIRALIFLNDLKNLISNGYDGNIEKNLNFLIDAEKYDDYRKRYYKKIVEMQNLLIEECAASIGKDKIIMEKINWCLERPEVKNRRFDIVNKEFQGLYSLTNKELYVRFLKKAIDSEIESAYFCYISTMLSYKEVYNYNDFDAKELDVKLGSFLKNGYREDLAFLASYDFLIYLCKNNYDIDKFQFVEILAQKGWIIEKKDEKIYFSQRNGNQMFDGRHYIDK